MITPPVALVLVGAVALKLIVLPLTLIVSVGPKLEASESVPAAPDNIVVPAIAAGGVFWLSTRLPVAVPAVVTVPPLKPSAASAAVFELVTVTPPVLLFSVTVPPVTVEGVVVPVIVSISPRTSPTVALARST